MAEDNSLFIAVNNQIQAKYQQMVAIMELVMDQDLEVLQLTTQKIDLQVLVIQIYRHNLKTE